jgi:mannitol-1-phosphate 5-dehydrogenase
MNKVMIIGAGASGRGHMGQLASESGYDLVFVDKDRPLVDALKRERQFQVRLVGARTRDVVFRKFEIFHTDEREAVFREFLTTPLLFTTVCPNNLKDVADFLRPMVVKWLQRGGGDFRNILCCENMNNSSSVFRSFLSEGFPAELRAPLEQRFGFVDTMIARVVAKPKDPLFLLGEEYSEWTADRHALRGPAPAPIRTLEFVEDQDRYLQRKLYIHNTGHATFGYLGFLRGYTYVHEAAQDPEIMEVTRKAIEESGWAVGQEHGFDEAVIAAYREALTDKCPCAELPDELTRVVREPMRKLGPQERFFGPIDLLRKHGREPHYLLYGVCGALLAELPGDAESLQLRQILNAGGVRRVLLHLLGEAPESLVACIEELLPQVKSQFVRRPAAGKP